MRPLASMARCFAALTLLFFIGDLAFAQISEKSYEAFLILELDNVKGSRGASERIAAAFAGLNPQANRVEWLYYFSLLDGDRQRQQNLTVEEALAESLQLGDPRLKLQYITAYAGFLSSQGSLEAAIRDVYRQGEDICKAAMDKFWCGRLYGHMAAYDYELFAITAGLKHVRKAIELLADETGPRQYYLYNAKNTLAVILNFTSQYYQAIQVLDEVFQWFLQNDFQSDAALTAANLANMSQNVEVVDFERTHHYIRQASRIAQEVGDPYSQKISRYALGKLSIKEGRPRQAVEILQPLSLEFRQDRLRKFEALALLHLGKAFSDLKRFAEAQKAVDEAAPLLSKDYIHEKILSLDVRYQILKHQNRMVEANAIHEELLSSWKDLKKQEDRHDKARLSAELSLQVEEERNRALQTEIALKSETIATQRRMLGYALASGILTLGLALLLIHTLRQKNLIASQRNRIKQIMDTVDDGLISIASDLRISNDHSQAARRLLGPALEEHDCTLDTVLLDKSGLSSELKSMTREILLNCLGEDLIAWELNAGNLPQELRYLGHEDRHLALRWYPVLDPRSRVIRSVLLSILDVTDARRLSDLVTQREKQLQLMPEKIREILQGDAARIRVFMENAAETFSMFQNEGFSVAAKGLIHTIKGTARGLGLFSLSATVHALETRIQTNADGPLMISALDEVRSQIQESLDLLDILAPGATDARLAHSWLPSALTLHMSVWSRHCRSHGIPWRSFRIRDGVMDWSAEDFELVSTLLLHSINNSLDHGFILPFLGGRLVEEVELDIDVQREQDWIHFQLLDNGCGLDLAKLEKRARELNFVPAAGQTWEDFVFHDGISTADNITETSGRGVGMSALKTAVQARGGAITIGNRRDRRGIVLDARWPLRAQLIQKD